MWPESEKVYRFIAALLIDFSIFITLLYSHIFSMSVLILLGLTMVGIVLEKPTYQKIVTTILVTILVICLLVSFSIELILIGILYTIVCTFIHVEEITEELVPDFIQNKALIKFIALLLWPITITSIIIDVSLENLIENIIPAFLGVTIDNGCICHIFTEKTNEKISAEYRFMYQYIVEDLSKDINIYQILRWYEKISVNILNVGRFRRCKTCSYPSAIILPRYDKDDTNYFNKRLANLLYRYKEKNKYYLLRLIISGDYYGCLWESILEEIAKKLYPEFPWELM